MGKESKTEHKSFFDSWFFYLSGVRWWRYYHHLLRFSLSLGVLWFLRWGRTEVFVVFGQGPACLGSFPLDTYQRVASFGSFFLGPARRAFFPRRRRACSDRSLRLVVAWPGAPPGFPPLSLGPPRGLVFHRPSCGGLAVEGGTWVALPWPHLGPGLAWSPDFRGPWAGAEPQPCGFTFSCNPLY